jgi:hypothetical protein
MPQLPRREEERRLAAIGIRHHATEIAATRPHSPDLNNGDEVNFPNQPFIGSYSKGLVHDASGDVDPIVRYPPAGVAEPRSAGLSADPIGA